VLGKGRWGMNNNNPGAQNMSGIDLLLIPSTKEPSIRGRHARLTHSLDSFSLLIIADKRTRVGHIHLELSLIITLDQINIVIIFGNLEYIISFTSLN